MRLFIGAGLALSALPGSAVTTVIITQAQLHYDIAPHVEYIEDPEWSMTLEEAMAPENESRYRPAQKSGDINFGFSRSAYWLRFNVVVTTSDPSEWLLEIRHPPLDRIEIYAPDEFGNYPLHVLGDSRPIAERAYPHRNLVLPMTLQNHGAQTIYMRVTTEGTMSLPLHLWEPKHFAHEDEKALGWLVWYLGMLGALMAYNLMLYASLRERVYLLYVGFVAGMALSQASYSGLAFQYLWPEWPQFAHLSLPIWMSVTGILSAFFTREFLGTRSYPWLDRILLGVVAIFGFAIFAAWFAPYQISAYLSVLGGVYASAAAIYASLYCVRQRRPGARYYLVAWSLLCVGVMVFSLRMLDWLPSVWITVYAFQIGSAFELLLLAFALADRINTMRREKEVAQAHALEAQNTMLKTLQTSELELEARIEDRTRALEMANRQLRESEQHLQHLVRRDPLTGLANRVYLYDRMSHALSQRRRDGGMLAVLLIDLDNFKPINDRFGHAIGDHLLVAIAERFIASVRESDTVARIGGDEFVVLLENVPDSTSVDQVVMKLHDEAAKSFEISGLELRVSASIGVALYPLHGADIQILLAKADAAMYAKKSARKQGLEPETTLSAI